MSDILSRFKEKLAATTEEIKHSEATAQHRLLATVGTDIAQAIAPFLNEIASSAKLNKDNLRDLMHELRAEVNSRQYEITDTTPVVNAIERAFGNVYLPEPKVSVTIGKPELFEIASRIKMPDEMNIKGWAQFMGALKDHQNPISVQLRDHKGNPINLMENLTQVVTGGGGGGKHDFFTIKGFSQSAFSEITNADGNVKVAFATGAGGLTDTELRAAHLDVQQVSGAIDSVYVTGIFGTTITSGIINGDDRIRVSVETGGSGLTNAELRATALPVIQVSGASDSVAATQVGTWNIGTVTTVTGVTNSIAANVVDSGGVPYTTSNPFPVSDAGGSLTIDGSVTVSGSITSTVVVGDLVSDAADDNTAPVKVGGIARQANPGAVAAGDRVSATYDDLGRAVTRPLQVRDLIQTAYIQLTTGTETTLRAAVAGAYLDLIYVMGANNSDAAVSVDIRPVTAGNVVMTLQIPASGTAGIACPVPLPQTDTGNNWTADMPDITGTTVSLTALFSQEI